MDLDLRRLQMMVESDNTIEHTRDVLTEAVEYFSSQPGNDWKVREIFQTLRCGLDLDELEEKNIFLYDSDEFKQLNIPEEFTNYSLGIFNDEKHCRYRDRLVYPVRDVRNRVMGLCGWDPVDLPKYLDSVTYGYNAKNNCLYGMEELPQYYRSTRPVFLTEGIVCCNYLRSKGFQSLALLGSSISSYVIQILNRLGYRCILLPDNDKAGLSVLKSAHYNLPKARCYVSTVAKDIDDTRKCEDNKYEKQLIQELASLSTPFAITSILRMLK